ncbi:hypothetical protein A2Z33_00200 [Candidatus Gottesmanbacteria bacterium RBG_16_52_11]|uniref:Endonuclease/exonuclease/phosphatase domain-containing protein n=1 Tax=Candidatus Gottesmanbacteria bacterium RBG_16_52_11 TaxID=1798374 RepID=A0A1F5YP55_9BACT|nr:MAG: hypothetical protein A2Z33_00200 [Candidatus Gottesmanbacteria bacterium RBG_16_52_11]
MLYTSPIMRLLEYNIESGGFGSYDRTLTPPPERLDLIKETVSGAQADVVVFVDTYRWGNPEVFADNASLAREFGYRQAYQADLDDERLKAIGRDNGIAVLTREDARFETIRLGNRNAVKASIRTAGSPLDIFAVYLDDLSEDVRLSQIRTLISHTDPAVPTIIAGDFNTLAPVDTKGAKIRYGQILTRIPVSRAGNLFSISEKIRNQKVIPYLESRGFTDTGATKRNPTAPTKKFHRLAFPILRLDYVMTKGTGPVRIAVIRNHITDRASDHYPVLGNVEYPHG